MQTASTASPRLRLWLALAGACSIVAGAALASTSRDAEVAMPAMPAVVHPAGFEPPPATEQAAPIAIVVVASSAGVAPGEPLPLSFYAVNRTAGPLRVLRSLDASDMGWRYPMIDIEIRDAKGALVEGPMVGRCGMINPLAEADFVELSSGGRVDLFGDGAFRHHELENTAHLTPGRYTVTLHYDLRFDQAARGMSPVDDELRALVDALPKGVFSSPPITIDVK